MKSEHPLHTQKSQAASYPENAVLHERQAQEHKVAGDIEKAFELYDRAGRIHKEHAEHRKSAICFSAAATCWNIHTGWQPLQKQLQEIMRQHVKQRMLRIILMLRGFAMGETLTGIILTPLFLIALTRRYLRN